MQNKRKHERFKLDVVDLNSRMSIVGRVEIIDMSLGGVALKADRKLNIGKEYLLMLGHEDVNVNIKGTVVRSELSGIEQRADGEQVTVYSAGIVFGDGAAGKVREFVESVDGGKLDRPSDQAGWRYRDIHFSITTPDEKVLSLPAQFNIKEISQSGLIIRTDQQLHKDSMVLMELSIKAGEPVSFVGKVVSCRIAKSTEHPGHDIGVEFSELTDQDRVVIKDLMDRVKGPEK